jgi:hypothetical protein
VQGASRGHAQAAAAGGEGNLVPGNIAVSAGVVIGFSLIGERSSQAQSPCRVLVGDAITAVEY